MSGSTQSWYDHNQWFVQWPISGWDGSIPIKPDCATVLESELFSVEFQWVVDLGEEFREAVGDGLEEGGWGECIWCKLHL